MRGANLSGANLTGSNLSNADFRRANLTGAVVGDADLTGANLSNAELPGVNLRDANLAGADLRDVDLSDKDLTEADLRGADLRGAVLFAAGLGGVNLEGAYLNCADLRLADFSGAELSRAHFGDALVDRTLLVDVDLSEAQGLVSVHHKGPSTIGIDTIYRSGGKIPESFLRGAGVPDNFITFMKSLTGAAFDFYSCFISYSTKDQDFADRLYTDLQAKGVRCQFAPHDIQGGRKIHEQIDEAIRVYDKLLLILSDASMNSEWVSTEISKARKRERREDRRMLFPISLVPFGAIEVWECFDVDAGKDSAREIREYFVPDFSNWKSHDLYKQAFERLVRDLKANPASPPTAENGQ